MTRATADQRRELEQMTAAARETHQLVRLNQLLQRILPANPFYRQKLDGLELPLTSLDQLSSLPFTCKDELQVDADTGTRAANRTWPVERYQHYHRTSGTRGRPLVVLDTAEDWQWWIDVWQFVLDAAQLESADRALMAFSFGPFIGFWSAYDAVLARGALAIPSGGLNTLARLELARSSRATALFCTPSYAMHMADVGEANRFDVPSLAVRRIVVAGEPGGSIPAVRQRIERAWNARVIDHSGATEVGPWGYPTEDGTGLHVVESEFLAEFISLETGRPARDGELSELILTTLGRAGCPVIRYRTGDLVRPYRGDAGPNRFVRLEGGVLGRVDDMMIIRGMNVFPSSIEQILRGFPDIVEYRMIASKAGAMDALTLEIEDRQQNPKRVARELQLQLGLRVDVKAVSEGTLPRWEGKARRFLDQR